MKRTLDLIVAFLLFLTSTSIGGLVLDDALSGRYNTPFTYYWLGVFLMTTCYAVTFLVVGLRK